MALLAGESLIEARVFEKPHCKRLQFRSSLSTEKIKRSTVTSLDVTRMSPFSESSGFFLRVSWTLRESPALPDPLSKGKAGLSRRVQHSGKSPADSQKGVISGTCLTLTRESL